MACNKPWSAWTETQAIRTAAATTPKVTYMNWNKAIRQGHRWLSMAFTLAIVTVVAAMVSGDPAEWVFDMPFSPLALLLPTGPYLFLLSYFARRGSPHSTGEER
ncbi:MAG: hypothetical protein V2I43_24605 [Parvularcula sp.]|jgi:hypothetical protein|nr:hypothetical protein [Parvularcula sp.]